MKASEIIDAMAELNDETLEEVGALRQAPDASAARGQAPSRPRRYWWIVAACLVFAVAFLSATAFLFSMLLATVSEPGA